MKNIALLVALAFVTITYAKEPIERESLIEAENFKVEKAVKQKEAKRAISGDKARKENGEEISKEAIPMTEDSDVHYWRYSEE